MNYRSGIKKNLFFSIFNQVLILCLGIVLPRLILVSYGSEVNGLISTVTQIFSYVALLEAGIGNASINALYKPITDCDDDAISEVVCATKKYYRKVTAIYFVCVIVLTVIYPVVVKTDLPQITVALVILLQGLSGVINFSFSAAYQQFLIADGKNYVVSTILLISYVLSSVLKIVLMCNGFNIVFLQIAFLFVSCIQACLFVFWIKKKYPKLKRVINPRLELLAQRNAFIVHEISGVIFSSTDVFVLSTFCSFKVASVYAIYNMVIVALSQLISSVNNGLNYLLGHTYTKDRESYEKIHDAYEGLYMASVFALFTVAYVLIIPFVRLYTRNITDIQYVDFGLPILFVIIQLMSCSRAVSSRLITISGHAKKTQTRSIIEAVINLLSSLLLVNLIGIYGVLLGTIIALLYRMNDIIIYANKKILNRSPWKTYRILLTYFLIFACFVICEYFFRVKLTYINDYIKFFVVGGVFTAISIGIYSMVAILINKEIYYLFLKIICRKNN